jgi:hypothetical protein
VGVEDLHRGGQEIRVRLYLHVLNVGDVLAVDPGGRSPLPVVDPGRPCARWFKLIAEADIRAALKFSYYLVQLGLRIDIKPDILKRGLRCSPLCCVVVVRSFLGAEIPGVEVGDDIKGVGLGGILGGKDAAS